MRSMLLLTLVIPFTLLGAALAESPEESATIGRQLEGIEKASTFIQLLKNTDKAESLLFSVGSSTTVFVPTNEAFDRMDPARRTKLFDPSNKHWLERVLTYHAVHRDRVDSYTVSRVGFLRNGLGQYLTVSQEGDGLRVDNADIVDVDLACSNGVVHFIDTVLDPVELDLFERLEADGRFTILTRLITRSGLSKLFQNRHQVYTVFAPTDEAFAALPEGTVDSLLSPEKLDLLSDVIRTHIAQGVWTVSKTINVQPLGTPGFDVSNEYEQALIFRSEGNAATIDGRQIVERDLVARNGFLHVIDAPLMPKRDSLLQKLEEAGQYETFLELCRRGGVYDLLGQFNEQLTVFAPVDSAFDAGEAQDLLSKLKQPENTDWLRGVLERHIVRGSRFRTTNAIAFQRLTSTLGARLDVVRDGNARMIQGVPIVQTDLLARNGVAHGIDGVIPFNMELPDEDQTWMTYRRFVKETLAKGSRLYSRGELAAATHLYARRNYEFVARYGQDLQRFYGINPGKILNKDRTRNFQYDFASTAWSQRNRFKELLRQIEQKRPLLIDELELRQDPMLWTAERGARLDGE